MKLGEKIKLLRKSKNISQDQLASMLNINRNYLSRVETGKSEPSSSFSRYQGSPWSLPRLIASVQADLYF